MPRQLCLIHANCQGDMLQHLLECSPAFAQRFTIQKYTNYLREPIPPELFDRCALFLYQNLDPHWGELASANLLARLAPSTHVLRIPNMFFNGYWPLWTNKTTTDYGDMLLEHLVAQGLQAPQILHLYLKGRVNAMFDLDALLAASQAREAAKEHDIPIPTLPLVRELWREEQLFYTINHPGPRLLLHVANSVLQLLGFPQLDASVEKTLYARHEPFELPIHPQVGAHFGFAFAPAERRYQVYGQRMTHAQYAAAYVGFKTQTGPDPIESFIGYLHVLTVRDFGGCAS